MLFRAEAETLDIAKHLDTIIRDPVNGSQVDVISNSVESRKNPNHLSFECPESELSFHTDYPNLDTPPRFVLLRCVSEGRQPIATQYVSFINFRHRKLAETLLREPWLMQTRAGRWKPCRVLGFSEHGAPLVRFSSNVMRPFFPRSSELCALATGAHEYFPVREFILTCGDFLLLDNWSGLHRRTAASAYESGSHFNGTTHRVLERVLLG